MRVPIQYALTYPDRIPLKANRLSLAEIGKLNFREMDFGRFPCLRMAYDCGRMGGTAPTVFNAANEVAVARFLRREISFLQIEDTLEKVMQQHTAIADPDLDVIREADQWARRVASE